VQQWDLSVFTSAAVTSTTAGYLQTVRNSATQQYTQPQQQTKIDIIISHLVINAGTVYT